MSRGHGVIETIRENRKLVWPRSNDEYKKFVLPLNLGSEEEKRERKERFENGREKIGENRGRRFLFAVVAT